MDPSNGGPEVPPLEQVEFLAYFSKPRRRGRLKPDEHTPATGLHSQFQQLLVVGHVDGDLADPVLAQVGRNHRAEQLLGSRHVRCAGADEIVVHHQDPFLTDGFEFLDDIGDGPMTVESSIERRHAAKTATQRTASRSLDGPQSVPCIQQVVPRCWNLGQVHVLAVVDLPQLAQLGVFQNVRPDGFGLPRNDRIDMLHGFVTAHGGMNPAHDHAYPAAAKLSRQFVRPAGLGREGGNHDQVRPRHGRVVRSAQVLVDDSDLPFRRRQAGQNQKPQGLPDAEAIPPAFLDVGQAHQWVIRIDQDQSHSSPAMKHLR